MGQEISKSEFTLDDFAEFHRRLVSETELLAEWERAGQLRAEAPVGGSEIEAWLIDREAQPASINQQFLDNLDDPLVVPELSTFNVELNTRPLDLGAGMLDTMYSDLDGLWKKCATTAEQLDSGILAIGILPTVQQSDLALENISGLQRYQALNEQVLNMRRGKPIQLDIEGEEQLCVTHNDVMLEAGATSFQIHLKVDINLAVAAYNASKLVSGPMVALAANSPFLFGRSLWDETRIPLFEQAVSVGGSDYSKRVTFGIRYARDSILECFEANRDRYPILLPHLMDDDESQLSHLRLHNGTIWRWNRPLVGFSESGEPHVRVEHRVAPSGPTIPDMVANAAFYFGYLHQQLYTDEPDWQAINFERAQHNFYTCARKGLKADVNWRDGTVSVQELLLEDLLPKADNGLAALGVSDQERERWLGIVRDRVKQQQNGANWQRQWIKQNGPDFLALVKTYHENQQCGNPVHEWRD